MEPLAVGKKEGPVGRVWGSDICRPESLEDKGGGETEG